MSIGQKRLIVSGIGTGVGKTVVSAILTKALEATYWKPIQAGDLDDTDSMKVGKWTSAKILKERFALKIPASPHHSADQEGISISNSDFSLPELEGNLIIEGAGGLMVPVNYHGLLYIDLFEQWNLPVVLVSRHYLGSINHTLLSVEALKQRNIEIEGIIFVGDENKATEDIISSISGLKIIGRIPETEMIDSSFISEQADLIKNLF